MNWCLVKTFSSALMVALVGMLWGNCFSCPDVRASAGSPQASEVYEKSVIPEANLALESSLASYQTGALDFLSVFSNFMNVAERP